MSAVLLFLRTLELTVRLHVAVPWLELPDAWDHASAAASASTERVSPELLLAIAFVESRYDPTATSRVVDGVRVTGRYPSTLPPARLTPYSHLYCGPLQTFAPTWTQCLAQRDLAVGYGAGVRELEQWLRDIRVRGNVSRALAGHGCGNYGIQTGQCNNYPERVRWIERMLLGPRPAPAKKAPPKRVATT
jgi:hypothetical protein